jgi:hypothetical protein
LAWDTRGSGNYAGRLYLSFTDVPTTNSADSDADIYVRYTDNLGVTWSPRIRVTNASSPTSQFMAGLAVDPLSGRVALSWYDCRNDPSGNQYTQFYALVVGDGFSNTNTIYNAQLNPGQSNAVGNGCGNPVINVDYGDYSGLAFYGGYTYSSFVYFGTGATPRCGQLHIAKVPW